MVSAREKVLIPIAASIGGAMWLVIARVSGMDEAWDSPLYFTIGVPSLLVVSFVLGFLSPKNPWIWGLALTVFQPIAAIILQPVVGPTVFVGVFFFAIIGAFCVLTAYAGAFAKKRFFSRISGDRTSTNHAFND